MKQGIPVEGVITEHLACGRYRVQLDSGPNLILYTAGRLAHRKITIVPGDRVAAELNVYDPTMGRILRRL
jgi:translation initiation factor IF-1